MKTKDKKNDVSLFQNNLELMSITENLVFTDPYYEAEMNKHTEGLDPIVKTLRDDVVMKSKVQYMLLKFTSNTCLLYTSPSPRDRQKSRMPSSA